MRTPARMSPLWTWLSLRQATTPTTRLTTISARTLSTSTLSPRHLSLCASSLVQQQTCQKDHRSSFSTSSPRTDATVSMPGEKRVRYSSLEDRLHPSLLGALQDMRYEYMTPVQQQVLDGKALPNLGDDVVVRAKTGTGKTIAFLLPTLQRFLEARGSMPKGKVGVLILSPTRELATQIAKECNQITQRCDPKVECHLAYGGSNKSQHLSKFMAGDPSVLVATPGRLIDYLEDKRVADRFSHLRALVLDEADVMLDSGFLQNIQSILRTLPSKAANKWQGLLYSATMPPKMMQVAHHVVRPGAITISTIDENETPTVKKIPQSYLAVSSVGDVLPALHTLLLEAHKEHGQQLKAIVFCTTARTASITFEAMSAILPPQIKTLEMHSRKSQPARERVTAAFKQASSGVMFCSDVVGRGMDFPNVTHVVQVGLPQNTDQYVHRVGRTGRADKDGEAAMILNPREMFFPKKNPQFPMKTRSCDEKQLQESRRLVAGAFEDIPVELKTKAYVGVLGHTKGLMKNMGLDMAGLVQYANEYTRAIGCAEPPELEAKTIGLLGLKGVPGLRSKKRTSDETSARSQDPPARSSTRLPTW